MKKILFTLALAVTVVSCNKEKAYRVVVESSQDIENLKATVTKGELDEYYYCNQGEFDGCGTNKAELKLLMYDREKLTITGIASYMTLTVYRKGKKVNYTEFPGGGYYQHK